MTHYERSSPEVERAIRRDEMERAQKERERELSRYKRQEELMEISGIELSQIELRRRINKLIRRVTNITSLIPAPLSLYLKDGGDTWEVSGTLDKSGKGNLFLMRDELGEREHFRLAVEGRGKKAEALHRERGLMQISMRSKNSEREIRPAEELFDRLISPLEVKMGIKPGKEGIVFQA